MLKTEQPVQSMFSSFRLFSPKMASGNSPRDSRPSGLNARLSAHRPVSFVSERGRLVKQLKETSRKSSVLKEPTASGRLAMWLHERLSLAMAARCSRHSGKHLQNRSWYLPCCTHWLMSPTLRVLGFRGQENQLLDYIFALVDGCPRCPHCLIIWLA
jgi:hypothetical protein